MLKAAHLENMVQLEYVERAAAKEVEQYSDVVSDLTSEKALLLINRRLAQAEEHNRQLAAQLKAKNEQLQDVEKLNSQLQNLLEVKEERLNGALQMQESMEGAMKEAQRLRDEATEQMKMMAEQHNGLPELKQQKERLEQEAAEAKELAAALESSLEKAAEKAEQEKQKAAELENANADLQKQADIAAATLKDEKLRNHELLESNKDLLRDYRLLEESRDRVLEVAQMYKGQAGNLEERVDDLIIDSSTKAVNLARHQARIEQLSSVVAVQSHQGRSRVTTAAGSTSAPPPKTNQSRISRLSRFPSAVGSPMPSAEQSNSSLWKQPSVASNLGMEVHHLPELNDGAGPSEERGSTPTLAPRAPSFARQPSQINGSFSLAGLLSGIPPKGLPALSTGPNYNPHGTPGLAQHVPVPPRHVPAGHQEWEKAMEASNQERLQREAAAQQAAWMAQGRGRHAQAAGGSRGSVPGSQHSHHRQQPRTKAAEPSGSKAKKHKSGLASQKSVGVTPEQLAQQQMAMQQQQQHYAQLAHQHQMIQLGQLANPSSQYGVPPPFHNLPPPPLQPMQQQQQQQQQQDSTRSQQHQGAGVHKKIDQKNRPAQEYTAYDHHGRPHLVQTQFI